MKRYVDLMEKTEKAGGVYDTAKYRYRVTYGIHKQLLRIKRKHLGTVKAFSEWKTIYTEL